VYSRARADDRMISVFRNPTLADNGKRRFYGMKVRSTTTKMMSQILIRVTIFFLSKRISRNFV
jgi:hypothetical protein